MAEVIVKEMKAPDEKKRARWRAVVTLPNLLTVVFTAVAGLFIVGHGMWRDEAQAFLIGRESGSFGEVIWNTRYEGHPPLWHWMLFVLSRFTQRPEAMQWLHVGLAAATVWLVARYAPFPVIAKVLFPFGYFQFFEYGIISRNYQLIVLLSVALCVVWQQRRHAYAAMGVLIALLSLSHVSGEIVAAAFGLMVLLETACTRAGWQRVRKHWVQLIVGVLIAGGGAAWSAKLMRPPEDSGWATGWRTELRREQVEETARSFWRVYVPVPQWKPGFWNTNMLLAVERNPQLPAKAYQDERARVNGVALWWGGAMAVASLVFVIYSWRSVVYLIVANVGLLAFMYMKVGDALRHQGPLFVVLIVAMWIAWSGRDKWPREWWRRWLWLPPRVTFVVLLGVQVWAGYVAAYFCWQQPFSTGRDAARMLQRELAPDDLVVVNGPDYMAPPVVAYLPGRQFYLPGSARWGTFTVWSRNAARGESAVAWAQRMSREQKKRVVIVSSSELRNLPAGSELLGSYPAGIRLDERFFVYRIPAGK